MIYLSRLMLNARSRQAQEERRNHYELHRTLSRAFGEERERWREARCLFRVEDAADTDAICVLAQSRTAPDWSRIEVARGYLLRPPDTKPIDLHPKEGTRLAFRLRANPTVCQEGKRRPIRDEAAQLEWLTRKGDEQGFRPGRAQVTRTELVRFRTASGQAVTLQAVLYEGVLVVTNAEPFRQALEGGVGSAKGFGFGLLSVAPARF